jgi:GT2 family glycosyltransferase
MVDNGSSDGSADLLAARFPDLLLLRSERNLGFAAGVNLGLRAALERGCAYVLLANNDTWVAPTLVPLLVAALNADPTAGMAGPLICYADAPDLVWYMADMGRRWLPVPRRVGSGLPAASIAPDPAPVDYLSGCGLLVRRAVFEQVGLLDERFFMYFEDADFCRRVRGAGFRLWVVPRARMWHRVSLSAARVAALSRERVTMYRVLFYRRHFSGLQWAIGGLFSIYAALRSLPGDFRRGQRDLVLPTLRGLWRGWAEHV